MVYLLICFQQNTAYDMLISDWSSDVCSSDLHNAAPARCNRSGAGTFGAGIFSPDTCVVKIQHYFAAERNETHEPRKIHRTGKGFSPIRANRGDPAESSATCAGTSAEGAVGG